MARNTFDGGGPDGATITTANAGGAGNNQFNAVIREPTAQCQFFSGAAHGAFSMQLATALTPGVGCGVRWNTAIGSNTTLYIRFYVWVGSNPTYPMRVFTALTADGNFGSGAIEVQVDGRLSIRDSFNDVLITNTPIIFGSWNRIEAKFVASQTQGQIELRLFTSMDSTTPTEILASAANRWIYSPIGTVDFGHTFNIRGGMSFWIDDIETSNVTWVGPVKLLYQASVNLIAIPKLNAAISDRRVNLVATPTLVLNGVRVLGTGAVLIAIPTFVAPIGQPLAGIAVNLTIHPNFYAKGTTPSQPTVTPPSYPYPPQQFPFRIIAQEILTGKIVDWDLPVQSDFSYTTQLSGPTSMTGSFLPEIDSVQQLGLDGYSYFLHVEISGEIRATAILLPPQHEEAGFSFTAEGFSSIPHYVTWGGQISGIGIDPLYVVRQVWNDVQNNPRSNLGIIVSNTVSDKKLGVPAHSEILLSEDGTTSINDVEEAPYELLWWNSPNDGETIDTLATQTPFDYKERVNWNSTHTGIELYVDLGYPRIGIPRDKLLFDDDNILEIVPVQESNDTYASEVIVIGAGEGSLTVRGYAAESFGNRLRKVEVITDKTVTTVERANAVATAELGLRKGSLFSIDELVILARHENATIGEYDVGDDVFVQVIVPWLTDLHVAWYRILSITYEPSQEIVRLKVARSDSFTYPTTPTSPPKTVTDDVRAAQAILSQLKSGNEIFEDWTWPDCPAYVGLWNDTLARDFDASGSNDAQAWLQAYIIARM